MKYKPNQKWNLWRIKSPLLRLPLAWVFSLVSVAIYIALVIVGAIIGAAIGVRDGVLDVWRTLEWRMLWTASTTWKKQ